MCIFKKYQPQEKLIFRQLVVKKIWIFLIFGKLIACLYVHNIYLEKWALDNSVFQKPATKKGTFIKMIFLLIFFNESLMISMKKYTLMHWLLYLCILICCKFLAFSKTIFLMCVINFCYKVTLTFVFFSLSRILDSWRYRLWWSSWKRFKEI